VLANVRVLFGLVTMRPSRVGDGATKSMLCVTRLGATADRQGAIVDRPGATDAHQSVTTDYKGVIDHQGITADG
jgi:hypothetical protein